MLQPQLPADAVAKQRVVTRRTVIAVVLKVVDYVALSQIQNAPRPMTEAQIPKCRISVGNIVVAHHVARRGGKVFFQEDGRRSAVVTDVVFNQIPGGITKLNALVVRAATLDIMRVTAAYFAAYHHVPAHLPRIRSFYLNVLCPTTPRLLEPERYLVSVIGHIQRQALDSNSLHVGSGIHQRRRV